MKNYVKDTLDTILKAKELILAATTVGVVVLNLWLSSKLLPMAYDISLLEYKVLANEKSIVAAVNDIEYIRDRVDQIYNLLIK